jgi:hypothetical protein
MDLNKLKEDPEWEVYFYIIDYNLISVVFEKIDHLPPSIMYPILMACLVANAIDDGDMAKAEEDYIRYCKYYKNLPKEVATGDLGIYI